MTAVIELYGNNINTTLASGISSAATSLTVASASGMPTLGTNQFFRITLNDAATGNVFEVIYAYARSGTTLSSLVRGQEGTTAVAWLAGDKVYEAPSAGAMGNLAQQAQVQTNVFNYAADTGSANAYAITLSPSDLATPVPGAPVWFLAANANTGPSTLAVNGGTAYPILGQAGLALQGGEIRSVCIVTYVASLVSYVLLGSGGPFQLPSTVSGANQAISLGQATSSFAAINGSTSQPFSTSQLNTAKIYSGSSQLVLSGASAQFTNAAGSALAVVSGAPGAVSSTSTNFVTGAQLQSVYKVGEIKMWNGTAANIAATWGNGWQLADGTNSTPDLRSRFIIGAGSTYAVGAIGGATTQSLTTANLPSHNHGANVNDPQHVHTVIDPGHNHVLVDPGHVHANKAGGWGQAGQDNGGICALSPTNQYGTWTGSVNSTASAQTGISIQQATTGVYLQSASTGITVTTTNTGSNTAFSILPPYYALLFICYTGIGA